jgi:hypothetical protein
VVASFYVTMVEYIAVAYPLPHPKVIFQRLCQLRADLHSYDWIDNFRTKTSETLTPGMDDLLVGQQVMKSFKLVDLEQDRQTYYDSCKEDYFKIRIAYGV